MENVHFLVPDLIGIERNHRFHGHQTEQLHQVILHHVAQGSGLVVIAAAMLDAYRFGHGDGHIVHITPVPDGLEERIGETEGQNVLHRFFAQVMVNAENLRFVEIGREHAIQLPGGFQVIADRFFHHNPGAIPIQPRIGQEFRDFAEHPRRRGHIKDTVGFRLPFLFQLRASSFAKPCRLPGL